MEEGFIYIHFTGVNKKLTDTISEDIEENAWFSAEEIEGMDKNLIRTVGLKDAIHDYNLGVRYPLDIIREVKE